MSLREAVATALERNPELVLARLDEQKAQLEVSAVREPLLPRVYAGSGMAYTYGFPVSIDGSAPSIIQARAERSIWNASRGLLTASVKEQARAAALGSNALKEEIALRTAVLYLDLERAARAREFAVRQVESQARVEASVRLRVEEGRELEIEAKRASVDLARARQRLAALDGARRLLGRALADVLGLAPGDEVMPAVEERPDPALPESETAAVDQALRDHPELRRLESQMLAKNLEARAHRAARLPSVNLVSQYSLLGKFNNYEDFFRRFQRHNFQIGASIVIPLLANPQDEARASQAGVEAQRLRVQMDSARARIESDSRRAWQGIRDAEARRDVARMELDLARDQVGVLLSQHEEGRATLKQLEEARQAEGGRWTALYDARYELERARLELLRHTHQLSAALR